MTGHNALLLCVASLYLISQLPTGAGTGFFKLKVVTFDNPGGLDNWGVECDYFKNDPCDYIFTFCLDKLTSDDSVDQKSRCSFGYRKSLTYTIETHKHDFPTTEWAGMEQPLDFSFSHTLNKIPPSVSIKVNIMDEDATMGQDDLIDQVRIDVILSEQFLQAGEWLEVTAANHTFMDMELAYECTRNWYGKYCNVSCPAPKENEHYTCNAYNGNKICEEGWSGPTCAESNLDVKMPMLPPAKRVLNKERQINDIAKGWSKKSQHA